MKQSNVALIVMLAVLITAVVTTSLTSASGSNEQNSTVLVSSDPLLASFSAVEGNRLMSFNNTTAGPWKAVGFWDYLRQGAGDSQAALKLHPWPQDREKAQPSYISQEVQLPEDGNLTAVLVARNAMDLRKEGCHDSRIALQVTAPAINRSLHNETIVRGEKKKLVLDISSLQGQNVTLKGLADKGGDCSLWNGEFTNFKALFIYQER